MNRHPLILLAVVSVMALALLGGMNGPTSICLGGGHEHAPTEDVEQCELGCDHVPGVPAPAPAEDRKHDCDCIDIELSTSELVVLPRFDVDGNAVPAHVADAMGNLGFGAPEAFLAVRPKPPWSNPEAPLRLRAVRATRLLI